MPQDNSWTLLLLAISAEVIGTSCLRLSEGMTRPLPTLLVFSAYALAMALLSKVVPSIHEDPQQDPQVLNRMRERSDALLGLAA